MPDISIHHALKHEKNDYSITLEKIAGGVLQKRLHFAIPDKYRINMRLLLYMKL
jgi:hypothetical protein